MTLSYPQPIVQERTICARKAGVSSLGLDVVITLPTALTVWMSKTVVRLPTTNRYKTVCATRYKAVLGNAVLVLLRIPPKPVLTCFSQGQNTYMSTNMVVVVYIHNIHRKKFEK